VRKDSWNRPGFVLGRLLLLLLLFPLWGPSLAVPLRGVQAEGEPEVDWRKQAEAAGLPASAIRILAEKKVLIGGPSFPQIFSAYGGSLPQFITSDSVLRAYNVLFEESLGRIEGARARALPAILRSILERLPTAIPPDAELEVDAAAVAASVRRAQITIGTALRLLGEDISDASEDVRKVIEEETRLVEAGEGMRRLPWLGASADPRDVLDYDRFRPRGFYVETERLARFFRAIAWLQDVPFHIQREGDLLTVVVLQNVFGRGGDRDPALQEAEWTCSTFVGQASRFLGSGGEPSVFEHRGSLFLDGTKNAFLRDHPDLDDDTRWDADLVVHVLPRIETPDSRLLGGLFEARVRASSLRPLPGGIDLVAALGSEWARAWRLQDLGDAACLPEAWPRLQEGDDLFGRYLRTLSLLVDAPDAAAPALFRGEAWAAKSANTVLAGWAQIRHAWALGAMDDVGYFCDGPVPSGWVEPDPTFFGGLLDLAIATEALLRDAGAFDAKLAVLERFEDVRDFIAAVARLDREGVLDAGYGPFREALGTRLDRVHAKYVRRSSGWARRSASEELRVAFEEERVAFEEEGADHSEEACHRFKRAVMRDEAVLAQQDLDAFEEKCRNDPAWPSRTHDLLRLQERWEKLQRILHRLEALSVKELRGRPFDASDETFIRGYAAALAVPMLYDGNAYDAPPPDRPPVASVFAARSPNAVSRPDLPAQIVHAGTGMPCAIYVLWPHEGREVLCRGGVMPYREVVAPRRLTDQAWAKRLLSDEAPEPPPWLSPITVSPPKK